LSPTKNRASALVLLLSAIALHQITYGLALIGGFSLGLASVLTTLGLAAVYGRQWLETAPIGSGVMQRLSVVSALATICIGLSLATVAVVGLRGMGGGRVDE
jgi:nickel/cobalt transporter (NicO) family protein